jgi:hypothetical protein
MRGMSRHGGSDGGVCEIILRTVPVFCAFIAFLFMAIVVSSGTDLSKDTLEPIHIISVSLYSLALV